MIFDPLYLLILVASGLLGFWAQLKVKGTFHKWSRVTTGARMTGAEVAREILHESGIFDVKIERVHGFLSDHYDPGSKTLRLSPDVYDSTSVAAAGVAAHEVGHAIQHARQYFPLQVRSFLAPAAAFGGNISIYVIILGIITGALGMAKIGVLLFGLSTLFVLVTLPVEFDASNRAKRLLPALGLAQGGHEVSGVRSVLNAAALTYVAAAVSSVAMLLYWMLRAGLIGGRQE